MTVPEQEGVGTRAGASVSAPRFSDGRDLSAASALFIVAVVAAAFHRTSEARDWSVFFAAGALFPLLVVAWAFRAARRRPALLDFAAGIVTAVGAIAVAVQRGSWWTIVAGCAFAAIIATGAGTRSFASIAAAAIASWIAAETLLWWEPAPSVSVMLGAAVVAAAGAAILFRPAGSGKARALILAIAPILFFFAATRVERLDGLEAHHHWSYLIGPAELIRRGGWLLWDVPSQYGFLSVLIVALFPASSTWQALYCVDVILLVACAAYCFLLLQGLRRDAAGATIAILLTVSAHFLIAGQAARLSGPLEYPSTGAYRFVWVYALSAVAMWAYRSNGRRAMQAQILGGFVWALASAWSFESFAYATSLWVPSSILLGVHAFRSRDDVRSRRAAVAAVFAGPLVLAAGVGIVDLVYRVRLGHAPDWESYWEFSRAYSTDVMVLPAQPLGPWIALSLVLIAGCALALPLIRSRDFLALAWLASAWGGLWAALSYYAARSHPNNATNLVPIAVTAAAVIATIARERLPISWPVGAACGALFGMVLVIPATNPSGLVDALRHSVHGYETNVAARFPPTDPELRSLMRDCGVGDGDPMMFLGVVAAPPAEIEGRLVTRPSLIPAIPVVLLDALPESRRRTYLDRFMERSAFAGGWILRSDRSTDLRLAFPGQTLAMVQKRTAVLLGEIGRFYRPVSERHSAHWQLIRVVRRGPER